MTDRLTRPRWALTTVAAALALLLLGVGTAHAAIAGANPGVTTDRPDLMSATIVSGSEVQVCFDKPVGIVPGRATAFFLAGYAAANFEASLSTTTVDAGNNHCVDAQYSPSAIGDIDQYTILLTYGGNVYYGSAPSEADENRYDSTTLTGSDTHNGTTGLTTAPDLTGIASPTASELSSNSLVFAFDQAVNPASITANGTSDSSLWMVNDAGSYCYAAATSVLANTSGRDLLAQFSPSCFSVTQAIEGGVNDKGLSAANDPVSYTPGETVATPFAPNHGVPIYAPDLVSATLDSSNPDAIDYTFNQPVTVNAASDFCFSGSMGQAQEYCAPSPDVTNITQDVIQATFGGDLAKQQEYGVIAQVYGDGACGANGCNLEQSTKIGDNAGAFARGFTTAPDVTGVTFDPSNDQVTVDLDQRLCTATSCPFTGALGAAGPLYTGGIFLLPSFGNPNEFLYEPIGYSATNPDQAAGPQQIVLQFPPTASDGRTFGSQSMIWFYYCDAFEGTALTTANGGCDAWNTAQIVAPISAGAILNAIRRNRAHERGRHGSTKLAPHPQHNEHHRHI
jgi:hypothetical protein